MDLTKNIIRKSEKPFIVHKYICCFNFDSINKVFNMGSISINEWRKDIDIIGIWKIKLIKTL